MSKSGQLMTENKEIANTGGKDLKFMLTQSQFSKRLHQVLGERMPQFVASVLDVANSFRSFVKPESVCDAAMIAAVLDLPVQKNLGYCWIVEYAGVAQFQMGYKGYIQLALRSGQYSGINACAINEEAYRGRDDIGDPIIDWDAVDETKPAIGYAVAWRLTTGFSKTCFWTREKVEEHAKRYSQAYLKGKNTPWKTHFDQMALKVVVADSLKRWGIMSVEMQHAVAAEDRYVVEDVSPSKLDELCKLSYEKRQIGELPELSTQLKKFDACETVVDASAFADVLREQYQEPDRIELIELACEARCEEITAAKNGGELFEKGSGTPE